MLKLVIFAVLIGAITAVNLQRVRCGPVCRVYCPNGFVLDENKCQICQCMTAPTKEVPTDPGNCRPVLCKMFCFYGWKKDDKGCDTCLCADPAF